MKKPTFTEEPVFSPGDLVAVGDLHGQVELLWALLTKLRDTGVNLLFLGDLIDRAKTEDGDLVVLNIVKSIMDDPSLYGLASVGALRGNHEDMFLGATKVIDGVGFQGVKEFDLWERNGGATNKFREMAPHAEWIERLPLYRLVGTTLFVHAGVRPHIPLQQQRDDDLIWIRHPFLNWGPLNVSGVDFVVHGHTPDFQEPGRIEITHNRLNLDSGAYFSGKLTAYNHNTREVFQV